MKVFKILLVSLLSIGCSYSSPESIEKPEVQTPLRWQKENKFKKPTDGWIDVFNDPLLVKTLHQSLNHNFDLKVAVQRMFAAKARAKVAGVNRLPTFSASLQVSRRYVNETSGFNSQAINDVNIYQPGFDISWEADLWGRLGDLQQAALFDYKSSIFDQQAAYLTLVGNVVRAWFNAVANKQQIKLIKKRVASLKESLEILEDGFNRGINSALDYRLARAALANERANLKELQQNYEIAIQEIEVFMGKYPAGNLKISESLPPLSNDTYIGVPAELIENRPDILALNESFRAAEFRLNAAYKNRFPTFTLTGSIGSSTFDYEQMFNRDSFVGSIVAGLTIPIFYPDELEGIEEEERANVKQVIYNYAQQILVAFQEVEAALSNDKWLIQREEELRISEKEAEEAVKLAINEYRSGIATYTTLLESYRRLFDAQSAVINIKNQKIQNRINLHLALGGAVF